MSPLLSAMASNSTKVRGMRRHLNTYAVVVATLIITALGFFSAGAHGMARAGKHLVSIA
jgi:hypothetical protein